MKKLIVILAILLSTNAFGIIDTIQVKTKILDVTVFFSGAQISRAAEIKTTKGKHLVVVDNLPNEINPQSIQVNGIQNCVILSVKHQLIYPTENKKLKEETDIENKIDLKELKIKEIKNKYGVFDQEERLLMDNSKFGSTQDRSSIAEIKEAAEFYRMKLNEIKQGKLNLSTELDAATVEIQELYVQLNEISSQRRKTYSQILITMECDREVDGRLTMSYYVASAGWTPTYDFRVDDITKPLNIVYNANVYQSSGEDWNNVNMKLSTNNPGLSGSKPDLGTWYLGQKSTSQNYIIKDGPSVLKGRVLDAETNEPLPFANIAVEKNDQVITGAVSDFDGQYIIKPIQSGVYSIKVSYIGYVPVKTNGVVLSPDKTTFQDYSLQTSDIKLGAISVNDYSEPLLSVSCMKVTSEEIKRMPSLSANTISSKTNENATYYSEACLKSQEVETTNFISNSLKTNVANLEYVIDIPYTIPSDGEDYSIKMKEVSLPVNYIYHAVPKLDNDVFLTAEITDWTQLNLLSGKSNIYYQGTYTGESFIDANKAADTLILSLGRDRNIIIKREVNKEMYDKRLLGSNVKETIGWDITVRNNKNAPIKIVINDQFPISQKKSIEVERLDYSSAKLDDKNGNLTWEFELEPAGKKVLSYKFIVKYPKFISLNL